MLTLLVISLAPKVDKVKFKKECLQEEKKTVLNRQIIVQKHPGEFIYYEKYLMEVKMREQLKDWSKRRQWLIKVGIDFKELREEKDYRDKLQILLVQSEKYEQQMETEQRNKQINERIVRR